MNGLFLIQQISRQHRFLRFASTSSSRVPWQLSKIGLGTRRFVSGDGYAVQEALQTRLCNLVDVGAGWNSGIAARTMGEVLLNVLDGDSRAPLAREQLHFIGKVGWLEGQSLADAVELLRPLGRLHDIVPMNAHVAFCYHPDVIAMQVSALLADLGLRRLDAVLLDHPEHFFSRHPDPLTRGSDQALGRMLSDAFARLEALRREGRLDFYGVSTDQLGERLPLPLLSASAPDGPCGFAVLQYPLSLLASPAAGFAQAQRDAAAAGLCQVAYRPLISLHPGLGAVRLSETAEHGGKDMPALLKEAFEFTIHLEKTYPPAEQQHHDFAQLPQPIDLSWAQILSANQDRLANLAQWLDVLDFQIRPTLDRAFERLHRDGRLLWWVSKYKHATKRLFERYTWHLEAQQLLATGALREELDEKQPALRGLPLAQRALRYCVDHPHIQATIVGVRQPKHLKDISTVLSLAKKN